jgi:hypothetical protein
MVAKANSILKTLQKHPDYIMYDRITGIFKGNPVSYIHVYMEKTTISNPYGLEVFSNINGEGYLINITETIKNQKTKPMKNQGLKKPSVKGLKTLCSGVVRATGLKVDGTLKKGYKYAKGGKIVKTAILATKKTVAKKQPLKPKNNGSRKNA